jgi:hypothetical protein
MALATPNRRGRKPKLTIIDKRRIYKLFQDGRHRDDLAADYDVSIATIYSALHEIQAELSIEKDGGGIDASPHGESLHNSETP